MRTSPAVSATEQKKEVAEQPKPGSELVVSLAVEITLQADRRVVVSGRTNLPKDTTLVVSIQDKNKLSNPRQTKTTVRDDGGYKSEAIGSSTGLTDGVYDASVTVPFAFIQPESVRKIIGDKGQHLKGPLVHSGDGKVPFGNIVVVEKTFSIGDDPSKSDMARLKKKPRGVQGLSRTDKGPLRQDRKVQALARR